MKKKIELIALSLGLVVADALTAADKVTFEDHILPLFRNKCLKCHNADKMRADLDLSNYDAAMRGSGNGPVLSGGNPDESLLYKVVAHIEKPTMPPKDKLPEKEIELIKNWVAGGLLMNSGSKAVMAAKPKVNIAIDPDSLGKRPEGPPPMPNDAFALDPYVRTQRTSVSTAMAVSPWSPLIAVGGQRQVLLYNTDTLLIAGVVPFNEGYPHSLKFSANGKNLVIGGGRGANLGFSTVWDITKGEQVVTVGDDLDSVLASDISPDQRFIAHGGPDRFLRIFSTETGEVVHKIKKHTDWVTSVRFSTDGKYVASGDRNGGLHIWETEPGGRVCSFNHGNRVTGLEWATTNVVVSASMDGNSKIFNVDEARQLKSWSAHSGGASSLARAMNGMLVTSGRNKRATLWDANGVKKRDFVFPGDIPSQAVPSHDAKLVIGSDWEGNVYVWNAADGKEISRLSLNPAPMADQFADAKEALAEKQAAVKTSADALQTVLDNIMVTQQKMAALDKSVSDATKAASAAKAAYDKLIAEKRKPAEAKVVVAAKLVGATTNANVAAKKVLTSAAAEVKKATDALAVADKAAKDDTNNAEKKKTAENAKIMLGKLIENKQKPSQANFAASAKALTDATAAKSAADKILTTVNGEVAKSEAVNKAAAKGVTDAQNAAKAGKVTLGKQIDGYNKQAAAARTKLNAAKVVATAADKKSKSLEVGKVYSALYNARSAFAAKKDVYASAAAAAKAATAAVASAQTDLDTLKKTDLAAVKAKSAEALKQAQANMAAAEKELAAAKAEVAKEQTKVDAATKAVAAAETSYKAALANVEKAKVDSAKAAATGKAARDKATAIKATYDKQAAEKRGPAEAIMAALAKAQTQSAAAKANTDKALAAINTEVKTSNTIFQTADKAAKAAETTSAAAKAMMDKQAADLAKQKIDLAAKQKTQTAAKAVYDGLIANKQKPAETKLASMVKAAKEAPVAKANADKALTVANAEVKAALMAYLMAETVAQTAEVAATKDVKQKAVADAKRKAADTAKAALDKLTAGKQKAIRAIVVKADAAAAAAPLNKAKAEKELAAVKVEVAKADATHKAAIKVTNDTQDLMNTTTVSLTKTQADHKAKAADATSKRNASNASKAALDKLVTGKQKPAQAAQAATAATATELTAAKDAGSKVMARINAELAETAKPVAAADQVARTAEATAKTAADNVSKMTALANVAKALIDTRKIGAESAKAALNKMMTDRQKPVEAKLAGMRKASSAAQAAHANVEKDHALRMQQLTQTIDTQGKTVKAKTEEANKLADELLREESQLKELKTTYEKLKTAAVTKDTKTAAK